MLKTLQSYAIRIRMVSWMTLKFKSFRLGNKLPSTLTLYWFCSSPQKKCFDKTLALEELEEIKNLIGKISQSSATTEGITERGFILLNKVFAEKGRHETVWTILRTFNYTDSLSLKDSFLHPKYRYSSRVIFLGLIFGPPGLKFPSMPPRSSLP